MLEITYADCLGFRRSLLLKWVWPSEIAKHSLNTFILGVQCRSRSSMLVPPERWSAVLVMISYATVLRLDELIVVE